MAKRCSNVLQHRETCGNGDDSIPSMFRKSKIPKDSGDPKPESRVWRHHFHVSPDCVPHMERVFSIVRKTCDQKPTEDLKDLDVNTTIWGVFMSVTLQAAIHLGQDCSMNLRSVKNQSSKSVEQLFWTTERLVNEQTETTGVSTINWDQRMWRESSLLSDGAVRNCEFQKLRLF